MSIVSISLDDKILKELDKLQNELGFSGRSEVIRAGLRTLLSEEREKAKLSGTVEGVFMVVNQEKHNETVADIRHQFNDVIKTEIHNHLDTNRCLHIFVVKGDSLRLKEFMKVFLTSRKVEYTKLFLA